MTGSRKNIQKECPCKHQQEEKQNFLTTKDNELPERKNYLTDPSASTSSTAAAETTDSCRGKKRKMGDDDEIWCRYRQNGVIQPLLTGN